MEAVKIDGVTVDKKNRIYSTPAYMYDKATPFEVFAGIEKLVKKVAVDIGKEAKDGKKKTASADAGKK
jgi:enhancing lycopene biosynthesis protein 2